MGSNESLICACCCGDEAVFYRNSDNCAFIDSMGEMEIYVEGKSIRFSVDHCPKCGSAFHERKSEILRNSE